VRRWEDNVKMYFKQTCFKIADWIYLVQDVRNAVIKFLFQ